MKSSGIYQQRSLHCCLASFCDSTLTSKDLLKMRKHQILLADLITLSSAVGSEWQDGRDILSSGKITWKEPLLQRHRALTCGPIPGSQKKHTAKQKTAHSLRWPTDHPVTQPPSRHRDSGPCLNCWPKGKAFSISLLSPELQKDAFNLVKKKKKKAHNMVMRHQATLDCH